MKKKILGGIGIGVCSLCIAVMAFVAARGVYTNEQPLAKTVEETSTEEENEEWSEYELDDAVGPMTEP